MPSIRTIGAAAVGAAVIGLGCSAAPAQAFSLWSWSFGSNTDGASGTFTTSDVSDASNPVGTYNVTQFTLATFKGTTQNLVTSSLDPSTQFLYNSSTNFGFTNSLGFYDSGIQDFDSNDNLLKKIRLSGSAAYQAGVPDDLKRSSFVDFINLVPFDINSATDSTPSTLSVSLLQPSPTSIPTPALLPGLVGLGIAALRKKSKSEQSQQVAEAIEA